MKYLVPKIYVNPDDTSTTIRKKVAQKLGVSVSSLRVTVVSKQWWRGNNGGMIELCVEAETNEFIHNTAFFQPVANPNHSRKRNPSNVPSSWALAYVA